MIRQVASEVAGASLAVAPVLSSAAELQTSQRKGRIRQSLSRWCYEKIPLKELWKRLNCAMCEVEARRQGVDGQASAWDWDLPKIPAQAILDALQHAFLTNNDAELGGHQWRRKEFTCDQNPI